MRLQNGPALPLDQQLCGSQKLQILHAIRALHPDIVHNAVPSDDIKFLLFADF